MRKALLAAIGAALMGTVLAAPARGDMFKTIADFNEAIRLDPKNAVAYGNRGMVYYGNSDLDRAIADFDEAIRLDPKDATNYNNRGAARVAKGDPSVIVYRTIVEDSRWRVPKAVYLYKSNGLVQRDKADVDLAIADFSEAARLVPKDALTYNNRGAAYVANGDFDRAIADFNEAIRLDPKYAEPFNQRCYVLAITGQEQQALADCDESMRLRPFDEADALDSRGFVHLKRGEFDSAIIDYDAALKHHRMTASSLYGRGIARLKNGDSAGGASDIAAAKAIQADIVDQFSRIGVAATE
jgi:tetratricopeptide (TPR) repeat protein